MVNPPFECFGSAIPQSPVLLSVPHGGRNYPAGFALLARLPLSRVKPLEDRYADLLVEDAVAQGHAAIVARVPRVWVDLNRGEREYDPDLVSGAGRISPLSSAKVRGGLGIVPRRVAHGGDIWRTPLSAEAFEARLATIHRPWHAAIAAQLEAIRAEFGIAVLLDVHSMPPLARQANGAPAPQIVIGDLFGRAAGSRFSLAAAQLAGVHGFSAALNSPYAGGHMLERHGDPASGVHAIQIEIDRSLYLDALLDRPGSGLERCCAFVARLAQAMAEEAGTSGYAAAAE